MKNEYNKESVTRHVEFETSHLLYGYNGKCQNLHGHSYKMEVTVSGTPSPDSGRDYQNYKAFGFCIDFKELDRIINEVVPDHMFVANGENCLDGMRTPEKGIIDVLKEFGLKYELMSCAPSAENMKIWLKDKIDAHLPRGLRVVRLKLWETTDSYAEWSEE